MFDRKEGVNYTRARANHPHTKFQEFQQLYIMYITVT